MTPLPDPDLNHLIRGDGGGGDTSYLGFAEKFCADANLPKPFRPRERRDLLDLLLG